DAGLGGGFLKCIEIDDHHVDGHDAVSSYGCFMFGVAADVEEATVDAGMECFDAAIEHFGEAGKVADVLYGESGVAESASGASGGDQLHTKAREGFREIDQAGLVGDAEQCASDGFDCMLRVARRGGCTHFRSSLGFPRWFSERHIAAKSTDQTT